MAPDDAASWVTDPEMFWTRVGYAEKRCDALEAWVLDFQWPREFPYHLFQEVAEGVYGQFRDQGLVVQIDFENAPAADGGDNPHIHAMISTRPLDGDGFANKKNRRINTFFRLAGGFGPRFHLADVLNDVAASHSIPVRFDGHSNAWRNLPPAEDRFPLYVKRHPETPKALQYLTERSDQRARRKTYDTLDDGITSNEAIGAGIALQLAIERDAQRAFRKQVGDGDLPGWNYLEGTEPAPIPCSEGAGSAYATKSGNAYVWNDDDAIRIDGEMAFDTSLLISRVASTHGLNGVEEGSDFSDCYRVPSEPDPYWRTPRAVRKVSSTVCKILGDPQWKEELRSWRDALVDDGSPDLASLVDNLGGLRALGFPTPLESDITAIFADCQPDNIWARYRLCMQAEMDDLSVSQLGRVPTEDVRKVVEPHRVA